MRIDFSILAKSRTPAGRFLGRLAERASVWAGSSWAFIIAAAIIVVWGATGPLFGYSNTWQLVINTGTTIVTFLMVFLIQRAQNKDNLAIQLKLDELVAAMEGASNRLIDVEDLSEEELGVLREHYRTLVRMSREDENITMSHSVEEAEARHIFKSERRRRPRPDRFAKPDDSPHHR